MAVLQPEIVFVDNSISRIFGTIESLRVSFSALKVLSGEIELRQYLQLNQPGVILLHLDLAPNDAINILNDLRHNTLAPQSFIVIYSDKQDDFVQQLAYDSGADAFITFHTKPALLKHFLLNLVRRKSSPVKQKSKPVLIDSDRFLVFNNGQPVHLPRKEFRLFELLYSRCGTFLSKAFIAEEIWKDVRVATTRTIDVHIYNIRRSFGKRIIQSQKGKGYRINKKFI